MTKHKDIKRTEKYSGYNYLVSLEKEYEKNVEKKSNFPYSVVEGDMESVKMIDVGPVALKDDLTSV